MKITNIRINGVDAELALDGKSAYELARDHGFEGTEEEWLASLKGETGEPGAQGEPGESDLSASANALRATVSGEIVRVVDVSPLDHPVRVTAKSKNYFDISQIPPSSVGVVNNGDGSLTVTAGSSAGVKLYGVTLHDLAPKLQVGREYALSAVSTSSKKRIYLTISGQGRPNVYWNFGESLVMTEDTLASSIYVYADAAGDTFTLSDIQIEEGTEATEYTPYTSFSELTVTRYGETATDQPSTYDVNEDGTVDGVQSLSPVMTLLPSAAGVSLEVEYRRDLNAFAEEMTAEVLKPAYRPYTLYGAPISLAAQRYQAELLFSAVRDNGGNKFANDKAQGGAAYGGYYFQYFEGGDLAVFDLRTSTFVAFFSLAEKDTIAPHGNCCCFGKEFYAKSDEFPLFYVNAYQSDLPRGTCYVVRIQRDGDIFTANIVQTIRVNFTDREPWTCSGEYKLAGNFVVDPDNGLLYAFLPRTPEQAYRFFRFALPKLSDGASITLSQEDMLKHFDVTQVVPSPDGISYPQDACYHGGKVYIADGAAGADGRRCILVVNTFSERTESVIDWQSIGQNGEPEALEIVDGRLLTGTNTITAYRFS